MQTQLIETTGCPQNNISRRRSFVTTNNGETVLTGRIEMDMKGNFSQIAMKDATDLYNEPTIFTQTMRGLKKVVEVLMTEGNIITRNQIKELLQANKVRYHYYCAVD